MMSSTEVNNQILVNNSDSNCLNKHEICSTPNNNIPHIKQEASSTYINQEQDFLPNIKNIDYQFDEVLVTIDGEPGRIQYFPDYILPQEAESLYEYLTANIKWQQREGTSQNGNRYFEPRLTYWFGKPYTYSKVQWDSNTDWDKEIEKLRVRLNKEHPIVDSREYNSVMCNYYRNNVDSIGWHSDDEISLGRFPKIASISLGCERVFEVCRREEYYSRSFYNGPKNSVFNGCTILYRFHLNPGSLLIMEGSIQEEFLHRVPKENKPMDGRINLTYRYIVSEEDEKLEKERRRKIQKHKYAPNRSNKTYQGGNNWLGSNQQHKFEKNYPKRKTYENQNVTHISDWTSKYYTWDENQDKKNSNIRDGNYNYIPKECLKSKGIRNTDDYKNRNPDSYNESGQVNWIDTKNGKNKLNKSVPEEDFGKLDYKRFTEGRNKEKSANSKGDNYSRNKFHKYENSTQNYKRGNEIFNNRNKNHENNPNINTIRDKNEMKREIRYQRNLSDVPVNDSVLMTHEYCNDGRNKEKNQSANSTQSSKRNKRSDYKNKKHEDNQTENKHQENVNRGQDWSEVPIDDDVQLIPKTFSDSNIQEKMNCNESSSQITDDHEIRDSCANPIDNLPESMTEKDTN